VPHVPGGISPAWLDALDLRYVLLKWIRVVAYFTEVRPLRRDDQVELVAAAGRDEDYAELIGQLCRSAGAALRVRWMGPAPECPSPFPPNSRWRRLAARLALACRANPDAGGYGARVMLCGNRRILDPVCGELLARRARVWWLYDRFALRPWLRWRPRGAGQLFCNSSLGRRNRLGVGATPRLDCRGVDLGPLVRAWLARRVETCGPRYNRLIEQIDAHFRHTRPGAVVLDEDATPMARAVVALARQHGATTWVVQHGAPCGRFGFAPLAADRILVWGRSSARQLIRWGVSPQRIHVTGSPWHDRLHQALAPARARAAARSQAGRRAHGPQILLLTTVPPRDERPDMVTHRLTRHTYAEMIRAAFGAVARLAGARLIVRLHPRAPNDPVVQSMLARFPSVRGRVVRRGSLVNWLGGNDCVLSCLSSAGVDATLAGAPVIQLLPQGSGDVLPHAEWGMAGTARTEAELDRLLAMVLDARYTLADRRWDDVFGDFTRPAAARIADAVLESCARPDHKPHFPLPQPIMCESTMAGRMPTVSLRP
jgi:hypothetical protein